MIAVDELLKQIRRTLKDEDKNSYSDDELLSYIQSGIVFVRRIIIQLNPEYLSVPLAEGTLEPGNNKITVDKSTSYIYDVRIDGKRIKPEILSSVPDTEETSDVVKCYCFYNMDTVKVFPIPTKAVKYFVVGIPDNERISLGSVTPFNADIDNLVAEYAILRAGMSDLFQMSQETQLMGTIAQQVENLVMLRNDPGSTVVKPYYGR